MASYGQNNGGTPTINGSWDYTANDVRITVLNNTNAVENRTLNLVLSNPGAQDQFILGGENIPLGVALGRKEASVMILPHNSTPGTLGFASPVYYVNEGGTNAVIGLIRTNGSTGTVGLQYSTTNGTAISGISFTAKTGPVSFKPGVVTNYFTVPIIDDNLVNRDHTVVMKLFGVTGGAGLGLTNATLIIRDNDIAGGYAEFDSASYGINEDGGYALLSVARNGSSLGTLSVQVTTTNGTAIAGTNYLPFSTNLVWNNGVVAAKTIAIPILDDGVVNTNVLNFGVRLYNATYNGSNSVLGTISNAVVSITNVDSIGILGWSTTSYLVNEDGGYAVASVIRTGGSTGPASVHFATSDGTAYEGVNYRGTNGTLFFADGEVSKSFFVPLIEDGVTNVDPFFFTLTLSAPVPTGILATQTVAIVSILDSSANNQPPGGLDTSVAFSADDVIHALWLQPDGKLLAGGDFSHANGLPRNRMARFTTNGLLDLKFSSAATNAGPNGSIRALLAQTDERILVGGNFSQYNSVNRNYLARLNPDASLDSSFKPGAGPDGPVLAVAETFIGASSQAARGRLLPEL